MYGMRPGSSSVSLAAQGSQESVPSVTIRVMIRIHRKIPVSALRLLLFDLDGTLVDSKQDLAQSINAMLHNYDRPELPVEVIADYIGDGAPMLVRRALGDPEDEEFFNEALRYFLDYYREHKLDRTYVYDGVLEALGRIRAAANGHPLTMVVLTNKPVAPSRAIVEALGLSDFFPQVYGGNSFQTKKPDPLGAQILMRELGVGPEQTCMIGDSSNDVLTGRNAGMWTIGLTYGFAPHTLEEAPPDVLVDTPAELAEVLAARQETL